MSNIRVPGNYEVPPALPFIPEEPKEQKPTIDPTTDEGRLALDLMGRDPSLTEDVALKKAKDWRSMTPAERWAANVKAAKLTEDEANAILDSILQNGYWEKTYSLYGKRLQVLFRTRTSGDSARAARALDNVRTNDPAVYQTALGMVNLACSLMKYNDRALPVSRPGATQGEVEDTYQSRYSFCAETIPGPVLPTVLQALADFDNKVFAALSEGAEHGF